MRPKLSEAQKRAFHEAWKTIRIRRGLYDLATQDRRETREGVLESRGEVLFRWYRFYKASQNE